MAYKIIVAHPGQQHSYKVASALNKNHMLAAYITTVYDKDNSFLMRIVKSFISKDNVKRANSRKNADLNDNQIVLFNQWAGLIEIFLARYDKSKKIYNWWQRHNSDSFGKKVAKYAIKNQVDAVITYDTNALSCFTYLDKHAPSIIRIMDVSAANRIFMKKIYEDDMSKAPAFANKLKKERSFLWNPKNCKRLETEIQKSHFFLAPSNFVRKSLEYSGIEQSSIFICPYGANFESTDEEKQFHINDKLEVVYVGNVTEMKGIHYLLEATTLLNDAKFHFTIVGAYDNTDHMFDKYAQKVTFTGCVTHNEVKDILNSSDVFVFPSLGEGLSLSVLEALSCGLPCVVTTNSGANDAITDYENGFVIDIQDTSSIVDKLSWLEQHRNLLHQMSANAKLSAKKFSWDNHEAILVSSIKTMIEIANNIPKTVK